MEKEDLTNQQNFTPERHRENKQNMPKIRKKEITKAR